MKVIASYHIVNEYYFNTTFLSTIELSIRDYDSAFLPMSIEPTKFVYHKLKTDCHERSIVDLSYVTYGPLQVFIVNSEQ